MDHDYDDTPMRLAVEWLTQEKISFVQPSKMFLKIGQWNYWPHKKTLYRDGRKRALRNIGLYRLQAILRPRRVAQSPQPGVEQSKIPTKHSFLSVIEGGRTSTI